MNDGPTTQEQKENLADLTLKLHDDKQSLRAKLEQAQTENERVRQANRDVMAHFEDMEAAKELAEARCVELEAQVQQFICSGTGPLSVLLNEREKSRDLRLKAEAVEQSKYEHALSARIPDGTAGEHFQDGFDSAAEQYDDAIDRYAQRLSQQADELEQGQ